MGYFLYALKKIIKHLFKFLLGVIRIYLPCILVFIDNCFVAAILYDTVQLYDLAWNIHSWFLHRNYRWIVVPTPMTVGPKRRVNEYHRGVFRNMNDFRIKFFYSHMDYGISLIGIWHIIHNLQISLFGRFLQLVTGI